jgi:hypothetical protein
MHRARIELALLGLGVFLAASPDAAMAVDEARLQRFFTLMDMDGDGSVSRPEFQAGKGAVFLAMDGNGSMTLTPDEMRLSPEGFGLLAGDDGAVDGEEFIAAEVASFDAIDKNQDHRLDFAELRAYVAKYSD